MLEMGIKGEKQLEYHLKKANVGMYALRDVNLQYNDMKAQIDFVVVTSHHCYFIECKNYTADIIHVDENGNFSISKKYGGKYVKKGINSPLSQAEDQLTIFKKICLNNEKRVKELLNGVRFNEYFRAITVFTNQDCFLNIKKAPSDMKYRILKVDNLIRQIEKDKLYYKSKNFSKEEMNKIANFILENNVAVSLEEYREEKRMTEQRDYIIVHGKKMLLKDISNLSNKHNYHSNTVDDIKINSNFKRKQLIELIKKIGLIILLFLLSFIFYKIYFGAR